MMSLIKIKEVQVEAHLPLLNLCQLLSALGRGGELDVDLDGLGLGALKEASVPVVTTPSNAAKRSSAVGADPRKGAKIAMARTPSRQENKNVKLLLFHIAVTPSSLCHPI